MSVSSLLRLFANHSNMFFVAERLAGKNPAMYMLTLEQMIENDYPIPSYMADIFQKPEGWVETPEPAHESLLEDPSKKVQPTIYALDCEMASSPLILLNIRHDTSLSA